MELLSFSELIRVILKNIRLLGTIAVCTIAGSAVVALAIEHTWAIDLVNALSDAGVESALNFRVPATVVEEAFASAAVAN